MAAPVEWRKGGKVLKPSDKHEMKLDGVVAQLIIHSLELADAGDYSCALGDQKTSASLAVNGTSQGLISVLRCSENQARITFVPFETR